MFFKRLPLGVDRLSKGGCSSCRMQYFPYYTCTFQSPASRPFYTLDPFGQSLLWRKCGAFASALFIFTKWPFPGIRMGVFRPLDRLAWTHVERPHMLVRLLAFKVNGRISTDNYTGYLDTSNPLWDTPLQIQEYLDHISDTALYLAIPIRRYLGCEYRLE